MGFTYVKYYTCKCHMQILHVWNTLPCFMKYKKLTDWCVDLVIISMLVKTDLKSGLRMAPISQKGVPALQLVKSAPLIEICWYMLMSLCSCQEVTVFWLFLLRDQAWPRVNPNLILCKKQVWNMLSAVESLWTGSSPSQPDLFPWFHLVFDAQRRRKRGRHLVFSTKFKSRALLGKRNAEMRRLDGVDAMMILAVGGCRRCWWGGIEEPGTPPFLKFSSLLKPSLSFFCFCFFFPR